MQPFAFCETCPCTPRWPVPTDRCVVHMLHCQRGLVSAFSIAAMADSKAKGDVKKKDDGPVQLRCSETELTPSPCYARRATAVLLLCCCCAAGVLLLCCWCVGTGDRHRFGNDLFVRW